MKLIIGLGNPGDKYAHTRHNAGFMAVDYLAQKLGFSEFKKADKFKSLISEGEIVGEKVLFVKPQTFMNLSGQAVRMLADFYKIDRADILVIYDEVEIPLGSLRIRPEGSAGGHNGMASVIQELASLEIPRIRLGIKPEKPFPGDLADYVLGKFTTDEQIQMTELIEKLPSIMELVLKEGIEVAMNRFN